MVSASNDALRAQVRGILEKYRGHKGALLMGLLDVQYTLGYVPELTVQEAAEVLNVSFPEVWGVLTFYADFKVGKKADHLIDVCIDTPCHVEGAERIWEALEQAAAQGTDSPRFELRRVSCPRLCAKAPVIALDQQWKGEMTVEKAVKVASDLP
ncbi:MAG: NAD(P)H-dependent oxidoreductase subunit E [Chloroflexi bacterium]|nr:NAD(P)H-dependent oxidoreductase subunit E [Chloroflexota bacterium]